MSTFLKHMFKLFFVALTASLVTCQSTPLKQLSVSNQVINPTTVINSANVTTDGAITVNGNSTTIIGNSDSSAIITVDMFPLVIKSHVSGTIVQNPASLSITGDATGTINTPTCTISVVKSGSLAMTIVPITINLDGKLMVDISCQGQDIGALVLKGQFSGAQQSLSFNGVAKWCTPEPAGTTSTTADDDTPSKCCKTLGSQQELMQTIQSVYGAIGGGNMTRPTA